MTRSKQRTRRRYKLREIGYSDEHTMADGCAWLDDWSGDRLVLSLLNHCNCKKSEDGFAEKYAD